MMSGKGDMPRPFSVDKDVFNDNWDRILRKKLKIKTKRKEKRVRISQAKDKGIYDLIIKAYMI